MVNEFSVFKSTAVFRIGIIKQINQKLFKNEKLFTFTTQKIILKQSKTYVERMLVNLNG